MQNHGKSDKDKIALFSGRFDPPHLGHIISMQKIAWQFKKVIIPVYDYTERAYPAQYCVQIIEEALDYSKGSFSVFSSIYHYGKISQKQITEDVGDFDVYVAAENMDTLRYMEKLGYQTLYLDRAYHYSGTDQRTVDALKKLVK